MGKDEKGSIPLSVFNCQNGVSANQYFSLSKTYQLRREDTCAVTMDSKNVILSSCNVNGRGQTWKIEKVNMKTLFFLVLNSFLKHFY